MLMCCCVKSEVDALQQLCLRAGIRQKDISTCSPNRSRLLTLFSLVQF